MNTFTRRHLEGRKPFPRAASRHASRFFIIPRFGTCLVSRAVFSGQFVGELLESEGRRYIVPIKPQHFPDARTVCYSGPRPYWFYFYVVKQEQI